MLHIKKWEFIFQKYLFLQEESIFSAEIFVRSSEISSFRAWKSSFRIITDETLLIKHGSFSTEERKVSGDILIVINVGKTHVEDGTVVSFIGVVAIRKVGTIET